MFFESRFEDWYFDKKIPKILEKEGSAFFIEALNSPLEFEKSLRNNMPSLISEAMGDLREGSFIGNFSILARRIRIRLEKKVFFI